MGNYVHNDFMRGKLIKDFGHSKLRSKLPSQRQNLEASQHEGYYLGDSCSKDNSTLVYWGLHYYMPPLVGKFHFKVAKACLVSPKCRLLSGNHSSESNCSGMHQDSGKENETTSSRFRIGLKYKGGPTLEWIFHVQFEREALRLY